MSIRIDSRNNQENGQQGQTPWEMRRRRHANDQEPQNTGPDIRIPDSPPLVYTARGRLIPLNRFLNNF